MISAPPDIQEKSMKKMGAVYEYHEKHRQQNHLNKAIRLHVPLVHSEVIINLLKADHPRGDRGNTRVNYLSCPISKSDALRPMLLVRAGLGLPP